MAGVYLTPGEAKARKVPWVPRDQIEAQNRVSANAPSSPSPAPTPQPVSTKMPQPGRQQPQPQFPTRSSGSFQAPDPHGNVNYQPGQSGYSDQYLQNFFRDLSRATGASVEADDVALLRAKLEGGSPYIAAHGGNPNAAFQEFTQQYARRGAPTGHRRSDSQGGAFPTNADPRSEPGYRGTSNQPDLAALLPHLFGGAQMSAVSAPQASPASTPGFDLAAYQAFQQANPNSGMSPFEFAAGRQWTDADSAALASGQAPQGVTPSAIQLYESGGMQWPGPQPSAPADPGAGSGGGQPSGQPSNQAPNQGGTPRTTVPAQFDDPITSFIEQFAQRRAQDRENPPADSGQALLEQALRDIAAQFGSGGFTNAEQEIYQTQAIDPIEQLRQARKQQVMHDLSRRGIAPNSGVAIQMLQDVDRQFDAMRTQTQAGLAGQFGQERVSRMLQSLGLLGNLAGTENQRLNEAFQYRTVPLNLADRSFNQAFQMYNAAGNPLSLINPLLQLGGLQQGRSDSSQEMLGYLAYLLSNSGGR